MKYESVCATINVNGENQEISYYKNPEYLRKYCSSFKDNISFNCERNYIEKNIETYLYFLPTAIDALTGVYHLYGTEYPSGIAKINIYNLVLISIKEFNLFSKDINTFDVYRAIFENSNLGTVLRMAVDSVMESDYYRAKYYVKNCVTDSTMRKILDKNLNGHKTDKVKINKEIFNLINNSAI